MWLRFEEPIPVKTAHDLGRRLAAQVGVEPDDVFPKITSKGKTTGWVRLPGYHPQTGKWSSLAQAGGSTPSEHWAQRILSWMPLDGSTVDRLLEELPPAHGPRQPQDDVATRQDGTTPARPTCEDSQLPPGVPEGERHDAAMALAGRLRAEGKSVEEINNKLLEWNQRNEPPTDPTELRDIANWFEGKAHRGRRLHGRLIVDTLPSDLEELATRRNALPSGFPSLDSIIGGIAPDMVVVGAAPGVGKSSFCNQIADHAVGNGCPALVVMADQGLERYRLMSLARLAKEDGLRIAKGDLTAEETQRLVVARSDYDRLVSAGKRYVELHGGTLEEFRKALSEFRQDFPDGGLVVVDALHNLRLGRGRLFGRDALNELLDQIRFCQQELDLPIWLISHQSRGGPGAYYYSATFHNSQRPRASARRGEVDANLL